MLIWWRHIVHFCQISHCTPRTCSYWVSAKVNSSPYDRNADTFTYYFGVFYLCFIAWGNTRPENELWVPEFQMSATDLEEELRRDGITSMIKTWHLTVSLPDPHMNKWCPSMCSQEDTTGPSLAWYYSSSQTAFITGQQDFLLGRVYEMPLPITLNTRTLTSLISLPVPLCSGLKPNLSKCGSTLRVSLGGKIRPHVYSSLSSSLTLDRCVYLYLVIWDVTGNEMLHTSNECLTGALVGKKNKYSCE